MTSGHQKTIGQTRCQPENFACRSRGKVLHAIVEGQRVLFEAQRSLATEVRALATDVKALIARVEAESLKRRWR